MQQAAADWRFKWNRSSQS